MSLMIQGGPTIMSDSTPHAWVNLVSRRDLLRVASLGVAGALLPGARAAAAVKPDAASAKSVIVLWMAGGVTHLESFDPKPDAPSEIRGSLGVVKTTLPGVLFNEVMPHLARRTGTLALLRSFVAGTDDHLLGQVHSLSGRKVTADKLFSEPNVGSVVSKLLGGRNGLPGYVAVPGTTRPGPPPHNLFTAAWLGREHDPFCTGGKPRNEDFTARVKEPAEEDFHRQSLTPSAEIGDRLDGRRSLRDRLDAGLRSLERA